MPDEKVIAFPGTEPLPQNPIQTERRRGFCQHGEVTLDEHTRMVHCRQCGATLEPFNFLFHNAQTLQTAWQSYSIVQNKAREVQDRIEILNKELRRLQGRVKTLQRKEHEAGGVLDVRGRPGRDSL
jgi:hypothetical protein